MPQDLRSSNLDAGQQLGPYELLERVGEGGMGHIFKARHIQLDRIVALKLIRCELLSQPLVLERFYREARAAAQLSHPNVVLLYDVGQVNEVHYLALEYLRGRDLDLAVVATGPLPIWRACDFVRQAALGLDHAHGRGVIHRDVKPANLIATRPVTDGPIVIKVVDFGLARLNVENQPVDQKTAIDRVVGTVDFMAPEQLENSHEVDCRADIYGLGATLFFLLTGRTPFTGETKLQRALARLKQEAPPIRRLRADVPPALEAILTSLLARDPAQRPASAALVADALEPFSRKNQDAPSAAALEKSPANSSQPPTDAGLDSGTPFDFPALTPGAGPSDVVMRPSALRPSAHHRPRKSILAAGAIGVSVLGLLLTYTLYQWSHSEPLPVSLNKDRPDSANQSKPSAATPTPPVSSQPNPETGHKLPATEVSEIRNPKSEIRRQDSVNTSLAPRPSPLAPPAGSGTEGTGRG